ncbi:MAG: DUF2946 family protein [Pseudomonadota bacterium]
MDEVVKQALAKWPNVPHCYGWLALDARGAWRMRDERAQHLGLAGDKITQAALRDFINRNYASDERGCWYFQNGPQRVYVSLEATPYIARTDPREGLVLHTGAPLARLDQAWLTEAGALIVQSGPSVAQLDDRDFLPLLGALTLDGAAVSDDALLSWLGGGIGSLNLRLKEQAIRVERLAHADVETRFDFVREPSS